MRLQLVFSRGIRAGCGVYYFIIRAFLQQSIQPAGGALERQQALLLGASFSPPPPQKGPKFYDFGPRCGELMPGQFMTHSLLRLSSYAGSRSGKAKIKGTWVGGCHGQPDLLISDPVWAAGMVQWVGC